MVESTAGRAWLFGPTSVWVFPAMALGGAVLFGGAAVLLYVLALDGAVVFGVAGVVFAAVAVAILFIALHRRALMLLFDVPSGVCRLERSGHLVLQAPFHAVRGVRLRRVRIGRNAGHQAEVQLVFDGGHVRVAVFADEHRAGGLAARLAALTGAEAASLTTS